MTGYGRAEKEGTNFTLSVEIKSVNNRFKDIRFKMGSVFNSLEIELKKMLEKEFVRGSFDIYVNYKRAQKLQSEIELDTEKIANYVRKISETLSDSSVELKVQPTEFLRNDFYVEDENKEEELIQMLKEIFPIAIHELKVSREHEGSKLAEKLKAHQEEYKNHYQKILPLRNGYQEKVKDKLLKRFEKEALDLKIEEPRLLQEVIYYLEKLDIDEEINRISIHLEKLSEILTGHKEMGRQIEFLLQELNRETNTVGSKSGDHMISESVVQMKVQLEKIREQALNLQ